LRILRLIVHQSARSLVAIQPTFPPTMSKASPAYLAQLCAESKLYGKVFGRMVNQVRNDWGMSQEAFAATVGISRTEMHHVEGSDTDMKLSTFFSSAAQCIAASARWRRISNIRWSIRRIGRRKGR